jgi:DNA invertase Pin-like site-specific DNA recombinase
VMPASARTTHAANVAQRRALAKEKARLVASMIAEIREGGATSYTEIARQMNERGCTTAQGRIWTGAKVRWFLMRLQER